MELEQYLLLLKKRAWILILGVVLGALSGYLFSLYQPVIYQTSTKIFISRASESANAYEYTANELRLVSTYAQLITTQPVLSKLAAHLGYPVDQKQITVRQLADSTLLQLTVTDQDPQRVAQIANSLVEVFIQHNQQIQAEQYQASEDSLKAQIDQVQTQIAAIEAQIADFSQKSEVTQQQELQQRLVAMDAQLQDTEDQIIQAEHQLAAFFPVPAPTSTPFAPWLATSTPVPTPTLSPTALVAYKETQNHLERLRSLRDLYRDSYNQLLVLGQVETDPVDDQFSRNQLQSTLLLYQQMYANLISNYEAVRLARLRSSINVAQVEPAPVPTLPIQPQPLRSGALGAVTGLMIMGGLAFLLEYLDDTLKTPADIERYLDLKVIASIGEMHWPKGHSRQHPGVYTRQFPLSPVSEGFYTLRTNLRYLAVDSPSKVILITSTKQEEGKTTLAVNLAAVVAQGNQKVVLVDADLRRPKVHQFLELPKQPGLSDLFDQPQKTFEVVQSWGDPPLGVITSGKTPPNPNQLLGSGQMSKILDQLRQHTDLVILDTPPAIVSDALALARTVDGVILLIEPGKTKIGMAQSLVEQFNRLGLHIFGVVLNPVTRQHARYYGKYYYNYSPYYTKSAYTHYFDGNGRHPSASSPPPNPQPSTKQKPPD